MDTVNFSTGIGGLGDCNQKYRDHNDLTGGQKTTPPHNKKTVFLIPGI